LETFVFEVRICEALHRIAEAHPTEQEKQIDDKPREYVAGKPV
jgi:hypothetical protein